MSERWEAVLGEPPADGPTVAPVPGLLLIRSVALLLEMVLC